VEQQPADASAAAAVDGVLRVAHVTWGSCAWTWTWTWAWTRTRTRTLRVVFGVVVVGNNRLVGIRAVTYGMVAGLGVVHGRSMRRYMYRFVMLNQLHCPRIVPVLVVCCVVAMRPVSERWEKTETICLFHRARVGRVLGACCYTLFNLLQLERFFISAF